jgi:hypothetical protein
LEALPVTIEALKQGNIGKLVKQLSKREETGLFLSEKKINMHDIQ